MTLVSVDKGRSPASGTDRYTANLIKMLLGAGCRVEVFAHAESRIHSFLEPSEDARVRWRHYRPPAILDGGLALILWHLFVLPVRLVGRRDGVVHVTNGRVVLFRAVFTLHDVAETVIAGKFDIWRLLYRRRVLYPVLRRRVPLLTVSETAKSDIARELSLAADDILVVPNVVFPLREQTEVCARETEANGDYILYVGRIDHPSKNLLILVEAFEKVAQDFPDCALVLAGTDSWGADVVHARVDRSQARERIHFTGFIADIELRRLVAGALVACQPSLHEGFGLPVIEAVNAGVPVLASNSGALPEILGDSSGCLPPEEPDVWASALKAILGNPRKREALLARQKQGIGMRFTPSYVLDDLMRAYAQASV